MLGLRSVLDRIGSGDRFATIVLSKWDSLSEWWSLLLAHMDLRSLPGETLSMTENSASDEAVGGSCHVPELRS